MTIIVRLPSLVQLVMLLVVLSPFFLLHTVVAESFEEDTSNSVSVSIPPILHTLSTSYANSSSSTSGFMFDLKSRSSRSNSNSSSSGGAGVVLYGLDINLIDDSTAGNETGTEVVVYTKTGSFRSYETNESEWTFWFSTIVKSEGLDVPTALLASRGRSRSSTSAPSPAVTTDTLNSAAPTTTVTTLSTISTTSGSSRVDDDDQAAAPTDDDDSDDDATNQRRRRQLQATTTSSTMIGVPPIFLPPNSRLAIYISTPSGPYLRYASTSSNDGNNRYYTSEAIILDSDGAAKRKGWDGQILYPRGFTGGLHYYTSDKILEEWHPTASIVSNTFNDTSAVNTTDGSEPVVVVVAGGGGQELLPSNWEPPTSYPTTLEPTYSMVPTTTTSPSISPTLYPTLSPSASPTDRPSWSPVSYSTFSTPFEEEGTKPVLVYAGNMFDIKGRSTIEISSLGIHTYLTSAVTINLYTRTGSYVGYEDSLDGWELRGENITVVGNGMGNPTYLPYGSFEPILLKEQQVLGVYITSTDGPYLRSSMGEVEGKPSSANPDMVVYEGIGKRYPIEMGGLSPRVFNGVFEYVVLDVPSPSPTMDLSGGVGSQGEKDMRVANATFAPIADTYIQRNSEGRRTSSDNATTYGRGTQLMVDGFPQKVSLLYFDVSVLNGNSTARRPSQVLTATLRLYSMTSQSMFGGYVDVLTNGGSDVDEDTTTWTNCGYGEREAEGFERMGQFRAVWPEKFYEIDVTRAFRGGGSSSTTGENDDDVIIPTSLLVRLSSDQEDGVMYRSREGDSDNGPRLFVTFAYNPDVNKALAREFGSDPPTMAPTVLPVWEDAEPPTTPDRTYFNYDPNGFYGPDYWENIEDDGYYDQFRRLRTDTSWNRCGRGERQSPRDLCATTDKCVEFHQTRPRIGEYGLTDENWARPTPLIMHNKLRLQYPERRSEWERPEPPGADFAHNVFNSGIQDILHIDLKVRSEHRLCGKQYDGEMQLFYIHKEGNLEALSILIEVDSTEMNGHFQIMLDYFQDKFDEDASLCLRRRTKARALFGRGREGKSTTKLRGKSSSSSPVDDDKDSASITSLGSFLFQRLNDGVRRLQQQRRRRTERPPTWNPLEPWYVLRSIHFWGYSGSITEPPCFEEVRWRVIDVPMKIHFNQYLQLKRLMFDHVDPDTCLKTSTHFEESNARPVQPDQGGATYRCRRSDYASDMERWASGRVKGFVLEENWWGVNNLPYITPEFPNV